MWAENVQAGGLKLSGTTGTHEKGDVPPGFSQTPAKIPASRAGTDDQKTHVGSILSLFQTKESGLRT